MVSDPQLGLTIVVAFDSQVPDAESENWELVQTSANIVGEGQQVCEPIQFPVQPIPVALWRIGFDGFISFGDLLTAK